MSILTFQPADVPDGGMRSFEAGDRRVLVTRDGDACHAFDAVCPHAGADLGRGVRCGARVVCPWHHAAFGATDGSLLEPPALQGLTQYRVRHTPEGLSVDPHDPVQAPSPPPRLSGHHTVLVGGGAAGFMTAQTLRAGGYAGRITLLTAEHRAPYDRTALSKAYLSGDKPAEKLSLGGPDWARDHDIDLREGTRVTSLDRDARQIQLDGGETLAFDTVVVATGATPHTLKVPGAELKGTHQLRSFRDAWELREAAEHKRMVIVGSSFIGLEAASSLVEHAASVTVVGQEAEILGRAVTPRVGRALRALHEDHGVRFRLDSGVTALEGRGHVEGVRLRSGERLDADVVLLGIGVGPNAGLLSALAGDHGGVPVDAELRAAPGVYAVGDIAVAPTVLGTLRVEHWRVALQHGMAAAQSILESPALKPMSGRVPFFWTQQYGKSLRYVGHAETLDDTQLWGDPRALKFIEFAFKDGVAVAASGMGYDADLAAFEELLRRGDAPDADEVRTGPFSLVDRLRQD